MEGKFEKTCEDPQSAAPCQRFERQVYGLGHLEQEKVRESVLTRAPQIGYTTVLIGELRAHRALTRAAAWVWRMGKAPQEEQ